MSEEFAEVMSGVLEEAGDDDLRALLGIVDASLGRGLSDSHKIAVWYAFLAEIEGARRLPAHLRRARLSLEPDGQRLCQRLIAARGNGLARMPRPCRSGLMGLIDQQWQGILFEGDDFDREAARRQCRAYLCSVFPWLAAAHRGNGACRARARRRAGTGRGSGAAPDTLPAWVYSSEEFHELEREHLFLSSWQIVCHVSEVAETGDYVAFEFFGRRGFVVRGERTASCAPSTMSARTARTRSCPASAAAAPNS